MGHEWTDPEDGVSYTLIPESMRVLQGVAAPLAREVLRLAERVRELEAENETVVDDLQRVGAAFAEEAATLEARIRELEEARPLTPFERIAADRLADEVASLVSRHLLDSRSAAADALLDYREPPRTVRSDRIAALEAEVEAALRGQVEISESNGRMFDKLQERERKLLEVLANYLNEDECRCEETESGPCMWCTGSALLREG